MLHAPYQRNRKNNGLPLFVMLFYSQTMMEKTSWSSRYGCEKFIFMDIWTQSCKENARLEQEYSTRYHMLWRYEDLREVNPLSLHQSMTCP